MCGVAVKASLFVLEKGKNGDMVAWSINLPTFINLPKNLLNNYDEYSFKYQFHRLGGIKHSNCPRARCQPSTNMTMTTLKGHLKQPSTEWWSAMNNS